MNGRVADLDVQRHRPLRAGAISGREESLARLLASGGDARITLDPETGLNRYFAAPYPRDALTYSSSTISDITPEAFAHLLDALPELETQTYADNLDALRHRIRAVLTLRESEASIVFAASGTDLEYVALACALGRAPGGVHNILLGADETGSGCIHSAHGRYFASETAGGVACRPGEAVAGCDAVSLVDVPVRCANGVARSSAAITADLVAEIERAIAAGKHALVHVVHGSKTGLVLPLLDDIDALQDRFGDAISFVVDACQARIRTPAIRAYIDRGCIIAMTGSKFMGAPPFNGWALIPVSFTDAVAALPQGFARIFRRAEWPAGWPGRENLEDSANLSLTLRLNAALFEWERFQAIPMDKASDQIDAFERAVQRRLIDPLGLRRVCPYAEKGGPLKGRAFGGAIEMRTLVTLDISALSGICSFEDAQDLHKRMALDGVRLGQPVKCVRQPDGAGWGATLRVGLSMPHMVRWAAMDAGESAAIVDADMQRIAQAIQERV